MSLFLTLRKFKETSTKHNERNFNYELKLHNSWSSIYTMS